MFARWAAASESVVTMAISVPDARTRSVACPRSEASPVVLVELLSTEGVCVASRTIG
jgi:hypothetical protein